MTVREVGRVTALWRYPVKSMAAEPLASVDVSWNGLAGDRRWAFMREAMVRSGFPWLTIRERPDMWSYQPSFADPHQPNGSLTMVRTPDGDQYDVVDPALAAALGGSVRAVKHDLGLFDTMPLSLISTQTIVALGALLGGPADVRRFRPNVFVETLDGEPFAEDSWVGRSVRIGAMTMRVDQRDKRCVMVNVDPDTHQRDPAVLRTIARERQACLGVYGSTVTPGRVTIGDPVFVD